MIDPTAVSTIRVGELSPEPFSLTDNMPHEVGTELKRGTIEDLATFISAFIGSTDGVGFRAISVTDGQTLPTTTQQEFILVGKGTYYNVVGGSTIICTEELNAIVSNGSYWFIGVEIPVNVELAGITQFIRDGFISTTPSEDAVYDALALKANVADSEDVTNKVSTISTYSTTLYPNEKATHDALDLKLNIADLPTNLTLYPTNVASDVSGYVKMVTNIHDTDYNVIAVDISTPTITTTDQLVASLITDAGVLIGQPGVFNATTFGNIRRLSGSGTATFYFKVFHRDSIGTETLIGTSSNTEVITSSSYLEFTGALLWDDGDFIDTDRIVIKYYANRIAGSSDPVYQFQFGGATPVRTLLPVPFSVVDAGYELKANKQNDLTIDGTGTKYPTVDAVNTIDLQKVINVGGYAEVDGGSSYANILGGTAHDRVVRLNIEDSVGNYNKLFVFNDSVEIEGSNEVSVSGVIIEDGNLKISKQMKSLGSNYTSIYIADPLATTSLNFPAKTVEGTYTLATTDETVNLIGDQTITGNKNFAKRVMVNRTLNDLDYHAYDDKTALNINSDQSINGYCSYDSNVTINPTVNMNHANSYQSRLMYNGSANIINTTGYSYSFDHSGTGTIANLYGINIHSPTGTGAITNKYGLLIGDYSGGFSIYSAGGDNFFTGKLKHAVGTINEDSALISDITTGTRAGYFSSLRLTNLTNSKLPYKVSDASGLVDSPIATDGSRVFIGGSTTTLKSYSTEIISSNPQLFLADSRTDNTSKSTRIGLGTYANANNPMCLAYSTSSSSANLLNIGGGTGIMTAPTNIKFYTASTVGVNTGTNRMEIFPSGNVGIATTSDNAVDILQVVGSASVSSTIKAGATVRLKNYTVATLPTGVQGDTAYVTDALSPTYLGVLVGGGAVVTPVFYNGTSWVSH